ncbi:MAG TPA: MFS transporter, partial [Polyangia bacterium]|nr:MFS transporter [Polyangia bacterium]
MSVARAVVEAAPARRRGLAPLPLLTAINFVNYFDRQIMYGLFPLVKDDLHLSDAQLGALGFGNLLVFALSSILSGPATRRFGPRVVVAAGVTVWSLATLGSALAPGYGFLLVMRALVGVGEGAFGP